MSSYTEPKFEGWQAVSKDSIQGNFKWGEYQPKTWCEDDVEISIQYCGICGSDLHTASGGWGDMSQMYPQVVGHEIVGKVIRVGKDVKHVKVGDIAGVGAQCDSCQECEWCTSAKEPFCKQGQVGTYGSKFNRETPAKGQKSYGGYANYWRGPAHFVIPIPENIDPAVAAPMLCGAVTVYTPLAEYGAGTKAKNVGIVGVGGLGHFGVILAKAMGASVTAITHGNSKTEDAKAMGADKVIVTGDDAASACQQHARSLDLIVCTSNDQNLPLEAYVSLIRPGGTFCMVGAPENTKLSVSPFMLLMTNVHITGSLIGSPTGTIPEMLKLVGDKGLKGWIQKWDMDKVNEAVPAMDAGKARYRYVLVNTRNGGKL